MVLVLVQLYYFEMSARISNDDIQCEIESVTHKWTVRNFSEHAKKEAGYFLKSQTMSYKANDNAVDEFIYRWYMRFYPNGVDKQNSPSLYIYRDDARTCRTAFAFEILILNTNPELSHELESSSSGPGYPHLSISTETLLDKTKGFLLNDSLTISCKITHITKQDQYFVRKEIPNCCLADDLSDLFEKKSFSDVTLIAQCEEFNVHKNILVVRSPVFASIFSNGMNEQTQNVIEIADIDKEVLRDMLRYLYCGKTPVYKTVELTSGLLAAAEKYDLERLKKLCEATLSDKLTIDNAADLLILADENKAYGLKSRAMDFVVKKLPAVMETEAWQKLIRNHSLLLNEILKSQLEHTKNK